MTFEPLEKQGFVGLLRAAKKGAPGARIPRGPEGRNVWEDARAAGGPGRKLQGLGQDPHSHARMETRVQAGGPGWRKRKHRLQSSQLDKL